MKKFIFYIYIYIYIKEQFIKLFSEETFKHAANSKALEYKNFANLVEKDERFEFLSGFYQK